MIVLLIFVFLLGVVTVLSPYVLPVVPNILAGEEKHRPLGIVLGLVISFTFLTLLLISLLQSTGISVNILRYIAILMMGFFGLVLILPYLSYWFAFATDYVVNLSKTRQLSGLVLGTILGILWTPFVGPILAAIAALVGNQYLLFKIVWLTLAYSLGAALPLLLISYGGREDLLNFPTIAKYSARVRQFFGGLLFLTAVALAFNLDIAFKQFVLKYFPNIRVESSSRIEQELEPLRPPPVGFPSEEFSPTVEEEK